MEGKVLDFQFEKEKIEYRAFLNLLRLGKFIEIKNIASDGLEDIYEYNVPILGFVFGYDFVTFTKEHKVYHINLDMNDEFLDDDIKKGIYVVELKELKKEKEYLNYLKENLDLAREIVKWYFDLFINKKEIEYEEDSQDIFEKDILYTEQHDINCCQIYKFRKSKKNK